MDKDIKALLTAGFLAVALSACVTLAGPSQTGSRSSEPTALASSPATGDENGHQAPAVTVNPVPTATDTQAVQTEKNRLAIGSGHFLAEQGNPIDSASLSSPGKKGDVTLNFERADIKEVIKSILGQLLKKNYTVDPRVKGDVTLQTSRPLARDALLPILESLLRLHNAVLLGEQGIYKIVPANMAPGSAALTSASALNRAGYRFLIIPLRYIAAEEMKKIVEPLLPKGEKIVIEPTRNLLMLSGTQPELQRVMGAIQLFDVDWLAGMSVGLFTLDYADPKTIIKELKSILGQDKQKDLGELIRLVSIERLNAVLAVSPQAAYLEKVRDWIARLDQSGDGSGRRLFVYAVQNSKADHLASILDELFVGSGKRSAPEPAAIAPGLKPLQLQSKSVRSAAPADKTRGAVVKRRTGLDIEDIGDVRIIADEEKNALVILSTPADYEKILSALRRLDVTPRQVLIEASIMEVELSGDLSYGVEWFFKNNNLVDGKTGEALLDLGGSGIAAVVPGFSYSLVTDAGAVRGVVNMLASESNLHVIASPSVFVLDNQEAEIHVGDQVPVRTSESANLDSAGTSTIVTSTIQFRDTGVRLNVAPRVNANGLVILDIKQEVSDVDVTTTSGIDSPTFNQRSINTTVAVHSGQSVILGGLIRENNSQAHSGIPVLYKLPVVGNLFGQTNQRGRRSELLVMISPQVVKDPLEVHEITREFQKKLRKLSVPAR